MVSAKLPLSPFSSITPVPTKAADYKEIYVNGTRGGISPWDIRMVFSCVKEIDNAQVNEDQVTIIVSPQHAKVLLKHWGLAIEKYEEQFGPIPDLGPILEAAQSNQAIAAETGRLEPVFVSPIKVRTTKKPKV